MQGQATLESWQPSALREARVEQVEAGRVQVRLAAATARPELEVAVALPGYQPQTGDRVLVQMADAGRGYLVGVVRAAHGPTVATRAGATATIEEEQIALRAADGTLVALYDAERGELVLSAPRDLKLRADDGRLSLRAAELDVRAERAQWAVGHWELGAERIIERSRDALRTVEGLLETRARQARTLVERGLELVARRTSVRSEQDTRIDGKRVLLG